MESNVQLENINMSEPTEIDLMICGSCKRTFQLANILGFMKHKKFDCEDPGNLADPKNKTLLCQACHQKFNTPWSLLKHAQNVHFLQIYLEQNYNIQGVHIEEEIATEGVRADGKTQTVTGKIHSEVTGRYGENQPCIEPTCNMKDKKVALEQTDVVPDATKKINLESVLVDDDAKQERSSVEAEVEDNEIKKSTTSESTAQTPQVKRSASCDSEGKEAGSSNEDQTCCDDQDCGITVMPGTHESLKKCCSAVVPKKRKRHMEIKHRISALARLRRQRKRSISPASIFIDLAPGSEEFTANTLGAEQPTTSKAKAVDATVCGNSSNQRLYPSVKQKSVIIQPGSTFSIPVSYAAGSLPPAIQIIAPNIQHAISSSTSSMKLISQTSRLPLVRGTRTSTTPNPSNELPNSVPEAGQSSISSDQDFKSPASLSPDSNMIQGIINQIFSEKTVHAKMCNRQAISLTMESVHPGGIQQDSNHANIMNEELQPVEDSGGTLSEQSDSLLASGRVFSGKKRRYPTSRPYKCEQCGDAFNQRIHLKKHQSKHTGIKPFKCDQCDYATVERSHLKVHIRVHTGEKPFKCTYCEYATAQKSTLKIHLKRHHATREHCFQCPHRGTTHCVPNLEHAQLLLSGASLDSVLMMENSPRCDPPDDKAVLNITPDVTIKTDITPQQTDQ